MSAERTEKHAQLVRIENELNVLLNLSAHFSEESINFEKQRKKSIITQRVVGELAEGETLYKAVGKCFVGTTRGAVLKSEAADVAEYEGLLESIKGKKAKAEESIAKAREIYKDAYEEMVKVSN